MPEGLSVVRRMFKPNSDFTVSGRLWIVGEKLKCRVLIGEKVDEISDRFV